MGSAEVFILGQRYNIRGDEPEHYIKGLAKFVDKKMSEIYDASPNIHPMKAAIMTALSIADDYYKLKDEHEKLRKEHESLTKEIEAKTDVLNDIFD